MKYIMSNNIVECDINGISIYTPYNHLHLHFITYNPLILLLPPWHPVSYSKLSQSLLTLNDQCILYLIFDLQIERTNTIIANLLEIPNIGEICPPLRGIDSEIKRGFVCDEGSVLNNITSRNVPRCLECPAGFFGAKRK